MIGSSKQKPHNTDEPAHEELADPEENFPQGPRHGDRIAVIGSDATGRGRGCFGGRASGSAAHGFRVCAERREHG